MCEILPNKIEAFKIKFNKFIVIESLQTQEIMESLKLDVFEGRIPDEHTGLNLFQDLKDDIEAIGVLSEYKWVTNRNELLSYLKEIVYKIKSNNERPIIHIECHGTSEGIILADTSKISWHDLSLSLIDINICLKNNLLITMAACKGIDLVRVFSKFKRIAFCCAIGPLKEEMGSDLEKAFLRFYKEFFKTKVLYNSFVKMFENEDDINKFQFVSTTNVFYGTKKTLKDFYSVENLTSQTQDEMKVIASLFTPEVLYPVVNDVYKKRIEKFLMLDLFPEERNRYADLISDIFP